MFWNQFKSDREKLILQCITFLNAVLLLFYLQLDMDFQLHYLDAVNQLDNNSSSLVPGIIAAAQLSHKSNVIELLREYDIQHSKIQCLGTYCIHSFLFFICCLNMKMVFWPSGFHKRVLNFSYQKRKNKIIGSHFSCVLVAKKTWQCSILWMAKQSG